MSFRLPATLSDLGDEFDDLIDATQAEMQAAPDSVSVALGGIVSDAGDGLARVAPGFLDSLDEFGDDIANLAGRIGLPAANELAESLGQLDELNITRLEELLAVLPPDLQGPDATGEVAVGLSDFSREEVQLGAGLAAMPRVVHTLGPDAVSANVLGREFTLLDRYEDNESGFSALRLRPVDGGPEVFAIDGLEVGSLADNVAAVDLGGLQTRSAAFAEMIADARDAALLEGRTVQFAGPSLGGAVAQVAAYETAEALRVSGQEVAPGTVEVLTVDSLGGRDAAEALNGGSLDPAVLGVINALNIRTEGDLISRIGSHLGPTLSFQPVDSEGNPTDPSIAARHVNVESLLKTLETPEFYAAGVYGPPAEISGFALVSNEIGDEVADAYLASGERDDPNRMVPLQIPGEATLTEGNTLYQLDADADGAVDLAVRMSQPVPPAVADLVL